MHIKSATISDLFEQLSKKLYISPKRTIGMVSYSIASNRVSGRDVDYLLFMRAAYNHLITAKFAAQVNGVAVNGYWDYVYNNICPTGRITAGKPDPHTYYGRLNELHVFSTIRKRLADQKCRREPNLTFCLLGDEFYRLLLTEQPHISVSQGGFSMAVIDFKIGLASNSLDMTTLFRAGDSSRFPVIAFALSGLHQMVADQNGMSVGRAYCMLVSFRKSKLPVEDYEYPCDMFRRTMTEFKAWDKETHKRQNVRLIDQK